MIRFGVCVVPFGNPRFDHAWLPPKPTVASWRALRSIGFTDVRMQFQVGGDRTTHEAPVSEHPDDWDTSLFRAFIEPAFAAGMRVNANYCAGTPAPAHQNAAWHEEAAYRMMIEFGNMIDCVSFGNEPGAAAQAYEGGYEPTPELNYMRDVYFPQWCLPFVRGVRRARAGAWILGCDADSADIQQRYTAIADEVQRATTGHLVVCNEEAVHPYYHVSSGALDYASLTGANGKPGFLDVKSDRSWGITEIDDSDAASPLGFLTEIVGGKYPGCIRYYELFEGAEHRWFAEGANAYGAVCSSFYTAHPVLNENSRKYAELFARANGPVDPVRTTMPVRKRSARK